ncbi:MAG TPA: transporter [Planctomycetaceae bacterium]|jgi:hypothetical protein|nr:transporter [Planctomycetaceae bacterium]
MEGGRSFLGFPAWLAACRGRVLACGLFAASAFAGASSVWADDPALLRSLAQRFDSPASVFSEEENTVSLSQTAEPGRMYVRAVEPPPGLDLEIVPPTVVPIRVAVPHVAVAPPPPLGLAMDAPPVVPQRIVMPAMEPPPLSLAVGEPPMPVPAPIVGPPAAGYARYDEPQPLQIAGLTLTGADQPPPAPAAEGSSPSGGSGSIATVEKLGDAPPSNSLVFLRQQALLLEPGKHQFDWGLTYSVFNETFALPIVNHGGTVVGVANERQRLRLMTIPFAFRYGVCDGVQAYINAPLGWANSEITTDNGESITNNFGGLGDLSAGFSVQLMKGCGAWCPDLIASLGFIAPTGHATFATSLVASNSFLGQGFWDITTNFIAVHTLDPVIFYYGAGYVHRFENSIDGVEVNPGEEFDYLFGVGFSVNSWVTISGTLLGSTITRYGANGVSLPGSDQDPIRFRIAATLIKDSRICEPFAEIAMTPDAPSRVGITFTY